MRLLFLADAVFEDLPGGAQTVAQELAAGLATLGHSVTFLVGRHNTSAPDREEQGGIEIVRYPGAGQGMEFVRQGRQAAARLWTEKPFDLIHTHFAYAAVGPKQAIPRTVPRVRTFHGPWDEEGWLEDTQGNMSQTTRIKAMARKQIRARIERRDLAGSDRVLTLSDCFRQIVTQRFSVKMERTETIAGGVDTVRFKPPQDKAQVKRELGLPSNWPLLLSIRRLAPRMGLDRLIAAMPGILAHHPEALLLIGGKGPDRERLERLITQTGLANHVRLLGFISQENLAAYYRASDLFVLPTLALEGFGLVTTEALACGLPVIGTPIGATPEILGALDPRLISPDTTSAGLASAIHSFFAGNWRESLSPECLHSFVLNRYSWEKNVQATEKVYHSLIKY